MSSMAGGAVAAMLAPILGLSVMAGLDPATHVSRPLRS
jgi:hypothetical protein